MWFTGTYKASKRHMNQFQILTKFLKDYSGAKLDGKALSKLTKINHGSVNCYMRRLRKKFPDKLLTKGEAISRTFSKKRKPKTNYKTKTKTQFNPVKITITISMDKEGHLSIE